MGNAEKGKKDITMKYSSFFQQSQKLLQKIWPFLFILFIWGAFAAPFLRYGKIPFPGDYQVTFFPPWSQYKEFAQPVKNGAMPDVIDQLYPWKHLVINEWKTGQIPLWNPYTFAGTPLLANDQSAVLSPLNVLFFLFSFPVAWALLILLQPLVAGFGTYWFVKKIGVSRIGATLSAMSFMFCSFVVTWMGYGTLSYAIGVLPFALLGLEGYVQSTKFSYLLLFIAAVVFSFFSGHFQMSLYLLLMSFAYFLFRFLRDGKKVFFSGLIGFVAAILLTLPQILPSGEFYLQSLRSTLFNRPEIIPFQYFMTLLAPDFFGNPVTRNNWFGHYAEWGSYFGVIPLLFAILSLLLFRKNRYVAFFSLAALVAFLLATPTFLGDAILWLHIPVLATSAAGRIIVLLSFSGAVLAGTGIDLWLAQIKRMRLMFAGIAAFFLLFGWSSIILHVGLSPDHAAIAKHNFVLPSIFLLTAIAGGLLLCFVKSKKVILAVALTLLLVTGFDMNRFASKWQSFSPRNLVFPDVGVTKFFQTIENQRSLGNYGGQVSIYYHIPSVEGYDALYPERFGELVSYIANGKIAPAARSVVDFPKNGKYTLPAINLLGIAYIIHKISDTNKPWTFPVWQYPKDFQIVYNDSEYLVLKNLHAFPRAFFVKNYVVKTGKQDILSSLFSPSFNPRMSLVLEKNPGMPQVTKSFFGTAVMESNTFNSVTIKTTSTEKALLFLSDTYFPGWHATIDGKETTIFRADYAFRAVVVPSGVHTVAFSYMPVSFVYGMWGLDLGVVVLAGLYFFQKKRVR